MPKSSKPPWWTPEAEAYREAKRIERENGRHFLRYFPKVALVCDVLYLIGKHYWDKFKHGHHI